MGTTRIEYASPDTTKIMHVWIESGGIVNPLPDIKTSK
jgi:hypothetical protein